MTSPTDDGPLGGVVPAVDDNPPLGAAFPEDDDAGTPEPDSPTAHIPRIPDGTAPGPGGGPDPSDEPSGTGE